MVTAGQCQCPKIVLADWKDREVTLVGHHFLSIPTRLFLHLPRRLYRDLEVLSSQVDGVRYRRTGAPLVLHRDAWFFGELMVSVDRQPADPAVQSFQNLFYSRVVEKPGFDAALRAMPTFYRDLRTAGVGQIQSMYFWYLNCPLCLIERGAQQIVLLARSTKVLASEPCPAAAAGGAQQIAPCQV